MALFSQSRGRLFFDEDLGAFRPGQSWQNERSAGASNGSLTLGECLAEGARAGAEAANAAGWTADAAEIPTVERDRDELTSVEPVWEVPSNRPSAKRRAFVDLQDDVTAKDLKLAVQEGYRSVEHLKPQVPVIVYKTFANLSTVHFAFSTLQRYKATWQWHINSHSGVDE